MIEMFVGSSSESRVLAERISQKVARRIPVISPRPWQTSLAPGNYTLPELIRKTQECQLALLLFSPDDIIRSRDQTLPGPRDNVLLEAGLFLSQLGPRRVALVLQDGVKFPTDLSGLIYANFSPDWSANKIANEVANQLAPSWENIRDPGKLGIEGTLRRISARSVADASDLYFPNPQLQRPVIIDSTPCTDIYRDGLSQVSKRFWTTSFLTSAFWTGAQVKKMLNANRDMLCNLAARGDGSARRIFLLPEDAEQYLLDRKAEVKKLRHSGDRAAIRELKEDVSELRKHVKRMTKDGFETRVVHDSRSRHWDELMRIVNTRYRSDDTELAIYDDFRVDLYSGGRFGVTDQVICFFHGVRDYESILSATKYYFESIWSRGQPGLEFLTLYEEAVYRAAEEIDYTRNWLARYDYRLSKADEALKTEEFEKTAELLATHCGNNRLARYLDIGSCTARYPLQLLRKGLFVPSPTIIALENDGDAYDVMQAKLELPEFEKEGVHIKPERSDFMVWEGRHPGEFDLITCMLGTVSHLAAAGPDGKSRLLSALASMVSLLAADGVLILGCWSDEATERRDFLAIYSTHDSQLLSDWSPKRADLIAALEECGLRGALFPFSPRMDLYFCVRDGRSSAVFESARAETA